VSSGEVVLEVRGATKRFGAVVAMADVSLELHSGEILALLGDNGAGKSTLIKCISGVHQPDNGELLLGGEPFAPRTPLDARRLGIETVYQDLALFDNLEPAQNFYAGREVTRPPWLGGLGLLRKAQMEDRTRDLLRELRVGVKSLRAPVGLLSGGQRQAIAVARAVAFASRVVILDEPTAALGVRESAQVLDVVRRLPERGISVVLISHNLEHVTAVADRAVVLRQGTKVGEVAATPDNHERIVSLIVGVS
jgi:D-xylose transport system ATP-binding protein